MKLLKLHRHLTHYRSPANICPEARAMKSSQSVFVNVMLEVEDGVNPIDFSVTRNVKEDADR